MAITFCDSPPDGSGTPALEDAKAKSLVFAAAMESGADGNAAADTKPEDRGAADGSGAGNDRYIQFAFMKDSFYLDLPNETLEAAEARQLLSRPGFYRLRHRRWPWMCHREWLESVQKHDPVQKEYLNSDTRTAAEDMAFVLYTLWKFPVDWQFYFRALRFHGRRNRDWEGTGRV